MNASPALTPTPIGPVTPVPVAPKRVVEQQPVPLQWRVAQGAALAVLFLFAAYWNTYAFHLAGRVRDPGDEFGFFILAGIIWLTTPVAATIAVSTLQEALRRRWVVGFLSFSVVVLVSCTGFTHIQMGEEIRVLQDFGTGFIVGMTNLIAVFLGVALIPPEVDRRIIFTILSKPVNRVEFLIGKFLGLCLTLLFCMVLLGAFFMLTVSWFNIHMDGWTGAWHPAVSVDHPALGFTLSNLLNALILQYGQLVVLSAMALVLSLFVTQITAITFCFLAYFGGQMSSYWGQMGANDPNSKAPGMTGVMQSVVKVVYYILPRLDHFDCRQMLVTDSPVTVAIVWKAWSAGLVYVAVILAIGVLVFSDREF